ncbi:MAG: hypothetical protein M3Z64_07230 [Verrucomicrobiota bacterium]|nr:hypothetical protein [Verrucomicrobiota bacterium]
MRESESSDCRGNVRVLAQREFLVRWARRLACLAMVGALGYGAVCGYGAWREKHLEKQAQAFAARGDVASAVLVARRVLALDQGNVTAMRVIADMAERARSAEAVTWRKAVAAAEPNAANNLALASTALSCNQITLAAHAIEKITGSARDGARYHEIAGAVALAEKHFAQAEQHFAAAHELQPDNHATALNLAIVRLTASNGADSAAEGARTNLRRLATESDVRVAALRALTADALVHDHRSDAARWAAQLISHSSDTVSDRLLLLEATLGTDAGLEALRGVQTVAAASAPAAAELITWLNRRELAQQALAWSATLPAQVRDAQPVPLAIAESLSCTRDWKALAEFVSGKNWREQEPLRLAIESHALGHSGAGDAVVGEANTLWRAALKAAGGRADQLAVIAELEAGWGYSNRAEEAWWAIANGKTNPQDALAALEHYYKSALDTRGLLRVAKRALELNPNDFVAANNCASLGLLLHSDNSSRRLAARLHEQHPSDVALAATYAFALHTEGKTAEGLQIISGFGDAQLQVPALAAYYVVMLVAHGETERARTFLPAAKKAALLPEEKRMLSDASEKLVSEVGSPSLPQSTLLAKQAH